MYICMMMLYYIRVNDLLRGIVLYTHIYNHIYSIYTYTIYECSHVKYVGPICTAWCNSVASLMACYLNNCFPLIHYRDSGLRVFVLSVSSMLQNDLFLFLCLFLSLSLSLGRLVTNLTTASILCSFYRVLKALQNLRRCLQTTPSIASTKK